MPPRLRRIAAAAGVAAVIAAGAGCGDDGAAPAGTTARPADRPPDAKLMRAGERVFAEHCHHCHTLLGRKHAPITNGEPPGTNFDEVTLRAPYVRERVELGGRAMQSFAGELSPAEQRAIVAYVVEVAGRDVDPAEAEGSDAELAEGERVFEQSCRGCHTLGDRRYTGALEEHGMNFNGVKPSVKLVTRMIRKGNIYMPALGERLSDAEIRAVAKYVASVAGEGGGTEL